MAYGLQVWNSSGQLILDVSDSLTRYLGTISVSGAGGFQVPEAVNGGRIWFVVLDTGTPQTGSSTSPQVYVDGTFLRWVTSDDSLPQRTVTVIYGVY